MTAPEAMHRHSYGETKAPAEVDTLRDEACPVCGEQDAYNGDECAVCFTGDTLVRTLEGYRPIAEIAVGDEVLSGDGQFHRVSKVMQRHYEGDILTLRAAGMASSVKVTPNHPFLTMVGHHPRGKTDPCGPDRCNRHLNPKPMRSRGTSQYLGVSWYSKYGKWVAQGKKDGQSVNLGYYESEAEAAEAAAEHRRQHPTAPQHHLGWVEAGELSATSYVAAATLRQEIDCTEVHVPEVFLEGRVRQDGSSVRRGSTSFEVTPDFLWMIGMYLAEGSTGARKIVFSLHADETTYQHRLVRFFEGIGYNTGVSQNSGDGVDVVVYSTTLSEWFPHWLGKGCSHKAIPAELLNLPLDKAQHLLSGILEGDGTNARQQLGQTSEILALQVAELALRRGGEPTLNHHEVAGKRPVWKVLGTTYSTTRREGGHTKRGTWRFQDRMLWRIRERSVEQYSGTVYNLSIEVDPTYVVQGVVVHNCGFIAPPKQFQDPDVDMHKSLDLRDKGTQPQDPNDPMGQNNSDLNRDGLDDETGLPVDEDTAAEEGALDQQPLLACNVCGEQFEAAHPQSVDTADPQNAEGLDGPAEGDLCPACGKGVLESGTELADETGMEDQADPNAIPDEDPDPEANPDDDIDQDGVPDDQDPDPTDPTVPGGGEEPDESEDPDDSLGYGEADSDDDEDDDKKPAGKGRPPFKR